MNTVHVQRTPAGSGANIAAHPVLPAINVQCQADNQTEPSRPISEKIQYFSNSASVKWYFVAPESGVEIDTFGSHRILRKRIT